VYDFNNNNTLIGYTGFRVLRLGFAVGALTLLVERQEGHPACKN